MNIPPASEALEKLELELLFEGIFRHYGLDFRHYAFASIKRRVLARVQAENLRTISQLQAKVLHEADCMERLLLGITIHVTAMFRDPAFYAAFRSQVTPLLRTYPFARLWVAGCATGEEAYSLAILLEEEGVYDRCRIYATDLSEAVLNKAQAGIFPLSAMQENTENYLKAGGPRAFSEYYTAEHDHAILRPSLRRNILFTQHNLAQDASFNEFHVILCRNVLIYFNKALQERVQQLIHESLAPFGVLALGRQESLRFTSHEADYDELNDKERIYRRKR